MKKRISPLVAETLRSIWKTRTRFLSILTIVAIGCGFFAGVKASCPDMKLTADTYYQDTRLMDLHLVSTFGFNDNDLDAIRAVEGIQGFSPSYSADVFLQNDSGEDIVLKLHSLPSSRSEEDENYLNRPLLLEGRFPEGPGECLVENNYHTTGAMALGSTIRLLPGGDGDLSDVLKQDTFTIVGIVQSPLYVGFTRGHSTIGNGQVDAFLLLPEEAFAYEVYTDVYLTLQGTEGLSAFSDAYEDAVSAAAANFDSVAAVRGNARYQEVLTDAQAEIDKAKAELADGEEELAQKLADAEAEIADAEQELADGRADYESGLADYNRRMQEAENRLVQGEEQLAEGENAYAEALAQYEAGRAEYEENLPAAEEQLAQYEAQLQELEEQTGPAIAQLDSAKALVAGIDSLVTEFAAVPLPSLEDAPAEVQAVVSSADTLTALLPEDSLPEGASLSGMLAQYLTAPVEEKPALGQQISAITVGISAALAEQDASLAEAREAIARLTAGIAQGREQLEATAAQLDEAQKQLEETRRLLDENDARLSAGWRDLANGRREGREQLEAAEAELLEGEEALADAKAEYTSSKAEAEAELADARAEIAKAERELEDLKEPTWYVWDRNNNPEYANYAGDAEKMDAIAAVFPIFFILVAALVCLTTMSRMVEEQRTQIGTLKALGYGNGSILSGYMAYGILASVIGAVVGLAIGFKLLPWAVINTYRIMYEMPTPQIPFRWGLGGLCLLVSVVCIGLTTFFSCRKQLEEMPSQLMRPKAPKAGKRVLLERISFIWKRLSFSHKVTVRNLFRYKQRALMTIVGIAGCTALMLTGFGLRYAITSIGDKQYENIFIYDTTVALDNGLSSDEMAGIREKVSALPGVEGVLPVASKGLDVRSGKNMQSITLMVPEDPSAMAGYIDLHRRTAGQEPLALTDGSVIINEKLARLLGLSTGDSFQLVSPSGRPVEAVVSGISENYALNYVYMTPESYRAFFREEPVYSTLLVNQDGTVAENDLAAAILEVDEGVQGLSHTTSIRKSFSDMLSSLNNIVGILILSAGTLAMVVLYNLANINVNERRRELATIKVLGFHNREVTSYITRENTITALIGTAVGLLFGSGLERFVIRTAEVDPVMFAPDIPWYCFALAGLLTMAFTFAVNVLLHFQLKKIDMVESLKSVE